VEGTVVSYLRRYPSSFLEALKKTINILRIAGFWAENFNPETPEYKPRISVDHAKFALVSFIGFMRTLNLVRSSFRTSSRLREKLHNMVLNPLSLINNFTKRKCL
jgi:hypothetical protein